MNLKLKQQFHKEIKGIALILTMIILSVVFSIAIISAVVFTRQIKMSSNIADSVIAYYSAESGIECELYKKIKAPETDCSMFETEVSNTHIKSIGTQNQVKRAIEVRFK